MLDELEALLDYEELEREMLLLVDLIIKGFQHESTIRQTPGKRSTRIKQQQR